MELALWQAPFYFGDIAAINDRPGKPVIDTAYLTLLF